MKTHPEQQPDEIYLGNTVPSNLDKSEWKTKRLGIKCMLQAGTLYISEYLKPWFIKRSEVQEALDKQRFENHPGSPERIKVYEQMLSQ